MSASERRCVAEKKTKQEKMTSRDERRGSKRTDRQRGRERMSDSTVAAEKGDRGRTAVSFNRAVLGHKYCFAIFVCLCTCFS